MRDRSRLISIELTDTAKKIYDKLQHKGEWVSDAIEEKAAREQGKEPFTEEQIEYLKKLIYEEVKRR